MAHFNVIDRRLIKRRLRPANQSLSLPDCYHDVIFETGQSEKPLRL